MKRGPRSVAVALASLSVAACAAPAPVADVQPGEQPPLESEEAGFWMVLDRLEERVRTSGRVERDETLNGYVRQIFCELAPDYCNDIRLYIVRSPSFNASMMANGTMQVWTGLLLRVQNEAQLAAVLGHELTHYLRRHTLQRWRDVRAKTDALIFFQLATAAAGVGIVGNLARLAALGSVFAFSREQEREADRTGFEMMVEAGYDPHEAPEIWEMLIEEKEADEEPERFIFFSTHPASEERRETLAEMAAEYDSGEMKRGRERFLAVTSRFRPDWLRDELRQRDFARLQVVLDNLMEAGANPGELHFFQGEVHRLRDENEDAEKAVAAYERALATGTAPAETPRALGLVYWSMDRRAEAGRAFEAYLDAAPEAEDRAMIEHYLQQLQ